MLCSYDCHGGKYLLPDEAGDFVVITLRWYHSDTGEEETATLRSQ